MIDADQIDEAKRVDLATIVRERGIRLAGRSSEMCGPCPACGGNDRFSVNLKKQVFNCRGCGAKGAGSIDLVMFLDGCDFSLAVETLTGVQPNPKSRVVCQPAIPAQQKPPSRVIGAGTFMRSYVPISYTLGGIPPQKDKDNRDIARWLWSQRQPPVEGCPVDLYLRGARAYNGVIPATLGYLPANGKHPPAMIAAFGFADEPEPGLLAPSADVAGVHITRLTPEGRKASVEPVKIMLGECAGKPIVLAPANDLHAIYLTEGIESGLSIFEECCVGVWAAGSAGNMPAIAAALPPYVKYVRIIAHHDKPTPAHPKDGGAGFAFAHQAARICELKKIEVEVHSVG